MAADKNIPDWMEESEKELKVLVDESKLANLMKRREIYCDITQVNEFILPGFWTKPIDFMVLEHEISECQ